MAVTLRRQISDDEKAQVVVQHGRRCFANGHEIPEEETVYFDHIKAYALGGPSEIDNIAPMCAYHNRDKGVLSLGDYRVKLMLRAFFEAGDKLTLRHLLQYLQAQKQIDSFALSVSVAETGGRLEIRSPKHAYLATPYTCPTTGWKYCYATLDVSVLDSDDDEEHVAGLQPRYLIFDKVFELYRHFQQHPVLQPSIGRIVNNHVRLFDGQHKVAALLWNGRTQFECKVYLDPDIRLLNQTNISAHDKFAQTRFFSSIMVLKLGTQFGVDFEGYKNLEDGQPKTELGFLNYLRQKDGGLLTAAQLNERFRSYLYSSVLETDDNRLKALVSNGNRSTDERPLTMDMLSKSLFSGFLHREPTTDDMATEAYLRDEEIRNVVELMNMIYDLALKDWNPKAPPNDSVQRSLIRLSRSKAMMAWSELLRDAVLAKLELVDAAERDRPFYRPMSSQESVRVREVVRRLVSWKRWSSPPDDEIDRVLSDNKSEVKAWFRNKGLTTGYLMGAVE